MPDFLPRKLAGLLDWSRNFDQQIYAAPNNYGLGIQQVVEYAQLHAHFAAAYQTANEPATRTASAIAARDDAAATLKQRTRELAAFIRARPQVSDVQKINLGLRVRKKKPTPIGRPQRPPGLYVVTVIGRTVKLRLSDPTSDRRGKPPGVDGATVLGFVGDHAPADRGRWQFLGHASRTSFNAVFGPHVAPGAKVWLIACWFNRRRQCGPASAPVSTHVQFGVAAAA